MGKSSVSHFEFSAYETGITKPAVGTKFTLNGNDNKNFKRYQDAYDDSPTNAFIIKTIVNYIVGNGLVDKSGAINPHDFLSKQDLRLLVQDFKVTGSAFPQIINYEGKPTKVKHTPVMRVGLGIDQDQKSNNFMDVDSYWYCWDYSKKYQFPPRPVAKFDKNKFSVGIEMMHIKTLSSEPYFPLPDWFSGLKSAGIEAALIDDAINHVSRGFQGKTIININNGSMMSDAEKEEIKGEIKKNYTGTENSDGVTVSVNDSADEALVVDTIEPRGRNEQFVTYDETAEIKLMAAHSAMNILFSRPGSNGFSNNAEEIATATDSLYLGVINPLREILLDSLKMIFKKINPNCELDFENFGQEKAIVSDVDESVLGSDPAVDDITLQSQAQLKGSVGGVQALLEVQASYVAGQTTYESAIGILDLVFGFNRDQAVRLLGNPEVNDEPKNMNFEQERDERGRFGSGDGSSDSEEKTSSDLSAELRAAEKNGLHFTDPKHKEMYEKIQQVRAKETAEATRIRREKNNPAQERFSEKQIEDHTDDLDKTFSDMGLFVDVSKSKTPAGKSNYVTVYENADDWENRRGNMKIRISDHTTSNVSRVKNEYHYDGNKDKLVSEVKKAFKK